MDRLKLSCGAIIYKSLVIQNPKGNVLRGIKCSDEGFVGFGEAYFSMVQYGSIKGWKKHNKMTMNLIVPVGIIRFYFQTDDNSTIENATIGENQYSRLFVPPGIWLAFEGIGESTNLLMNLASIEHNPEESVSREFIK